MPIDEMNDPQTVEYARRLAASKARRRPVPVGAPDDRVPDMGGGYAQSPRPAAAPVAPAPAYRELEGPDPLSSPAAAPMNLDEQRAMRLAARNRVFDAQRAAAAARAGVRQGDPASFVNARQAEANLNDVQGDYNAARDVGRIFQTPEQHAIAIAALRQQLAQNTGGTGGRVGPEVTPNPKDIAKSFFLDNGAERYQGATQVATTLAGANMRRQSLNADQNAPRGAEFDSPINYEERAARLAAANRYKERPDTVLELQTGRDQNMLADKARQAGTAAAGYSLDTAPVVAQTGLERARRDLTAASDTVTPEYETEAKRSAAIAAAAKGRYDTARYGTEANRIQSGAPNIDEQIAKNEAEARLSDSSAALALKNEGITDINDFLNQATTYAQNLGSATGFSGLGQSDARANTGIEGFNTAFLAKMERLAKNPYLAPRIADWAAKIIPSIEQNLPESDDPSALGIAADLVGVSNPITSTPLIVRHLYRMATDVANKFQEGRIGKIRESASRARALTRPSQ